MKWIWRIFYKYWMKFAHTLGKINSVIILTVLFIVVVGIYAIISKIVSTIKFIVLHTSEKETYWIDKKIRPATLEELKRQF